MFAKLPLHEQLDAWLGAGAHMPLDIDATGDVVVHGAVVTGHPCIVVATDYSKQYGSIGADEAEQITEALDVAVERGVPLVFLLNSGGMRVTEGMATIDALRRLLRNVLDAKLAGQRMFAVITRNAFGGTSALASLCERRAMNAGAVLAMSGPKLIQHIAGRDALDASDADAVRALIGGEARAAMTASTELCEDTAGDYHDVLSDWLDEPAPDSDDFIYDWAEELHERLGDRALRAPAPVPLASLEPETMRLVRHLVGDDADVKRTGPVLFARPRKAGRPVVVGLIGGADTTAPAALALAALLLRIVNTPEPLRIVVLLDSESHSADPADERVVLSEYLALLALATRYVHDEGHNIEVVVTGVTGGGIFAALAGGATQVEMLRDARLQVLSPEALAAIGKTAEPDTDTLWDALDAGAVDAEFPDPLRG